MADRKAGSRKSGERKAVDPRKVLEVAIRLADAHGVEALTLAGVADELGIRIPSLYNHVAGLSGLRRELRLWGIQQLADQLRRSAVGKAGGDAIFSLASAYRAFAHAHPGIYRVTLQAIAVDDPELIAAAQELLEIVVTVLQPSFSTTEDTLHAVRGLRSVLHGFVDLEIVGGFGMDLDLDESFQQLLRMFVAGVDLYPRDSTSTP